MDTITHGRAHPRPRPGDKAAFVYEKDGATYEGEIFFDNMQRVLFAFDAPKVGIKNENTSIPYRRTVVLGEGGLIKQPILWFDAADFFLTQRNGQKIYYPGDELDVPDFNRTFKVIEAFGDILVCSSDGVVLMFTQPSLERHTATQAV